MPILLQRASASSIECVVRMTELCFFSLEILDTMFHMKRLACGSTPVEGSSKKIIGGLPIIAKETLSFLLLPPDRFYD